MPRKTRRLESYIFDVYYLFMDKICVDCLYVGKEQTKTPYILIIDIILVVCLIGSLLLQIWLGAIFWGIVFALYLSLVRARKKHVCPKCGHPAMIPLDTPKAQELIRTHNLIT